MVQKEQGYQQQSLSLERGARIRSSDMLKEWTIVILYLHGRSSFFLQGANMAGKNKAGIFLSIYPGLTVQGCSSTATWFQQ